MINTAVRDELAGLLIPRLATYNKVSLAFARQVLQEVRPDLAAVIDGMEASHVLRRSGFHRDYDRPVGPALYRRNRPA